MDNYYISLLDKGTKRISNRIPLKDVIYNQNEIEFEFGEFGTEEYETLPYKDFLFWSDDYEVVLEFDKKEDIEDFIKEN